jgi:hypothetical protein
MCHFLCVLKRKAGKQQMLEEHTRQSYVQMKTEQRLFPQQNSGISLVRKQHCAEFKPAKLISLSVLLPVSKLLVKSSSQGTSSSPDNCAQATTVQQPKGAELLRDLFQLLMLLTPPHHPKMHSP